MFGPGPAVFSGRLLNLVLIRATIPAGIFRRFSSWTWKPPEVQSSAVSCTLVIYWPLFVWTMNSRWSILTYCSFTGLVILNHIFSYSQKSLIKMTKTNSQSISSGSWVTAWEIFFPCAIELLLSNTFKSTKCGRIRHWKQLWAVFKDLHRQLEPMGLELRVAGRKYCETVWDVGFCLLMGFVDSEKNAQLYPLIQVKVDIIFICYWIWIKYTQSETCTLQVMRK